MAKNQIPKFNNIHLIVVNSVTQFRSAKKVTKKNSFRRKTKKSNCSAESKENRLVRIMNVVIKLMLCICRNMPIILTIWDKLSENL